MSSTIVTPRPEDKKLGRLPGRSDPRALMFARYVTRPKKLPEATRFWGGRKGFPLRSFGNVQLFDCTRAKQAIATTRMERLETRRTPDVTDDEVIRVYFELTKKYGGGDTGAYETDALSAWRKPDETFRDTKGRPLTIDSYVRLNAGDQQEIREAICLAGAHGIAVCFQLPEAWKALDPPRAWDIPEGQEPTGQWLAGSWGGHSMWARDYDHNGIWVVHTWGLPDQLVTWRAAAIYMDEAHLVIDSHDYWRKTKPTARKYLDFDGVKKAVNKVSSYKLR